MGDAPATHFGPRHLVRCALGCIGGVGLHSRPGPERPLQLSGATGDGAQTRYTSRPSTALQRGAREVAADGPKSKNHRDLRAIGAADQRADAPKHCKDKDLRHCEPGAVAHSVALPRADALPNPEVGGIGEAAGASVQGTLCGTDQAAVNGLLQSPVGGMVRAPVGCMDGVMVASAVVCMVTGAVPDAGAGVARGAGAGVGPDAVPAGPGPADGFLARLVASWPTLPEPVKAGIRAMVDACRLPP